ncbi:MAG: redoxin domain-containing protein [Planctomycetes bacterium]|nr:redoxin domain-containing protein [Planctomycetota bacterium]
MNHHPAYRAWCAAALLAAAPASLAQQTSSAPAESAKERLEALLQDFDKAQNSYFEALSKLPEAEQEKYFEQHAPPDAKAWAPKVWAIADEVRKTPAAMRALEWLFQSVREPAERSKALGRILEDHLADPGLKNVCLGLAYDRGDEGEKFLQSVLEKGADTAKAFAHYALAKRAVSAVETAERLRGMKPEERTRMAKFYGQAEVDRLAAADPKALSAAAEKLLDEVAAKYTEVEVRKGQSIAESAKAELFEMRNLVVGKTAPDIVGEDLDGAAFKLSDYRGKVVVLDFWGNW